jgi:hypothetical protein
MPLETGFFSPKASHIMKSALILVCLAASATSCVGDAQTVLHEPVMHTCVTSGLTDCRNVTQATLLFAKGNPLDGRRRLLATLGENQNKRIELERFALSLEQVSAMFGDGAFQASLQPAVYLLREAAQFEPAAPATTSLAAPKRALSESSRLTGSSLLFPSGAVESSPSSVFFMLAGNALAGDCRFPGSPKMRCVHEDIETARIVSDISISAACPYDVLFASRHGIEFDWATYAAAGRGSEVHGAELPLIPGRTLTAGVGFINDEAPLDVRCGITVVWRDVSSPSPAHRPQPATPLTWAPSP